MQTADVSTTILGVSKRDLLKDVLSLFGASAFSLFAHRDCWLIYSRLQFGDAFSQESTPDQAGHGLAGGGEEGRGDGEGAGRRVNRYDAMHISSSSRSEVSETRAWVLHVTGSLFKPSQKDSPSLLTEIRVLPFHLSVPLRSRLFSGNTLRLLQRQLVHPTSLLVSSKQLSKQVNSSRCDVVLLVVDEQEVDGRLNLCSEKSPFEGVVRRSREKFRC